MNRLALFLITTLFAGIVAAQPPVNQAPAPSAYNDNTVGIEMVFVKGGTFKMGCTAEQGSECESDEKPAHSVTVSDFYIGKYEVTQEQWVLVMGGNNNPSYFKGGKLPVERVSWYDVQEFILRLNTLTGKKYRLPTEAEWEYAACGGQNSKGYKYSGSHNVGNVAWYDGNSDDKTHSVGTKLPNELGIYDMSGNVYEWVSDWYGEYNSTAQTNPKGPSSGSNRVGRGGSWPGDAGYCRVSYRGNTSPGGSGNAVGFRLVLSP
jgi:formylglycine-generating enzyme required for sulfatase activity